MLLLSLLLLQQRSLQATQPAFFTLVVVALLILGGVGWLVAAVLGFARAPAFGPSARWFSYAAVCLIIYHLHFALFGLLVLARVTQGSELNSALGVGAFFNLFVVFGAFCMVMGFVRLTKPR
jgi:hypothetical protein